MFDFHKVIALSINYNGVVTYNGFDNLFQALYYAYPSFSSLTFIEQMRVLSEATLALDKLESQSELPLTAPTDFAVPKEFWYDFEWTVSKRLIIKIYDSDTGNLFFMADGSDLLILNEIDSEFDVEGVRLFLVKIGELLPTDTLVMSG